MKRIVALLLFLIILIGAITPICPIVSAAVYNPRLSLPDNARTTIKEYMVDSSPGWGNYNSYSAFNIGNCTWYAFGRAWEILGYFPNDLIFSGDAGVWFDKNKEKYDNGNGGYLYSTNRHAPALGAIAVWQDTSKPYGEGGHVAVVEQISDNGDGTKTIVTSESAYASYYFRTITRSTEGAGLGWSGKWLFLGYIYINGTDGIDPGSPYPEKPSLNNFPRSYSSGETTTFTWDSTGNTTHYNLYIDKRNADGSWEIDYKYWHYATSGLSYQFDDGIYRVLLQSTNADAPGWPYTNSDYITFTVGPHAHDKGRYMFYEAVHPHYDCYECSFCGEIWRDTSSSNEMDNCYYCQRPGKPTLTNFATSYAVGQTVVFSWSSVPKATHYNLYIDKQQSDGTWVIDYRYWHYATSGLTTSFDDAGTYRVLLQATNSNFPGEDGTGWAYTNADYITFAITPVTVEVTFEPNGGSVSPASATVTIGSTYGNLPTPTRTNYNFDGWYTAASGGNLVTASTTVTATTNHTLYAHWTHVCAGGHNYSYSVETAPTTAAEGTLVGTCSRCGETISIALPVLTTEDYEYTVVQEPTCTADGIGCYTWKNTAYGTFSFDVIIPKTGITNPFTDIEEGIYYYEPVLWAYYHDPQITSGTSETTFGPKELCTRAEVVTFLWRAAGSPEPQTTASSFTDIQPGKYYYEAVLWAVENGITAGVSETSFGPNNSCTRSQAMTFLWRFAGSPEPESESPFADVKPEAYYSNAVLWAFENGVTSGTSDNTFSPETRCTRGQIITFLYRYMNQ